MSNQVDQNCSTSAEKENLMRAFCSMRTRQRQKRLATLSKVHLFSPFLCAKADGVNPLLLHSLTSANHSRLERVGVEWLFEFSFAGLLRRF